MNLTEFFISEIKTYISENSLALPSELETFLNSKNLFGFQKLLSKIYDREIKRTDLDENDRVSLKRYLVIIELTKNFLNILNMLNKGKLEKYYIKKFNLIDSENRKKFIGNKNEEKHNSELIEKINEIINHINQPSSNESFYFIKIDLKFNIPNEETILDNNENIEKYFMPEKRRLIYEDVKTSKFDEKYEVFESKEAFIQEINQIAQNTITLSTEERTLKPITIIFYVKGINFIGGTPKNIGAIDNLPIPSNMTTFLKKTG